MLLGISLARAGRPDESVAAFRRSLALAERLAADFPAEPEYRQTLALNRNNFAWMLATDAEPKHRDSGRAVELAKKAVELATEERYVLEHARRGLLPRGRLEGGDRGPDEVDGTPQGSATAFDGFFLAMAHWQLGDKPQARSWYDKAVSWMEKNQPKNEELIRFRAEAAALLGVNEK